MKALITGGAGFVGSALVRRLVGEAGVEVVNADALTYAASPEALADLDGDPRYAFEQIDVCDGPAMDRVLTTHRPDAVVHLAAETHVDRSIDDPTAFVRTNVVGTATLLEASLRYWRALPSTARGRFRLLQVSTDEVYGDLPADAPAAGEEAAFRPSSPYAATKAAADHLGRAWHRTYGLPVVTSRGANTYGPWQFPEKLVPTVTLAGLEGRPVPVYGDGGQIRDWLHVDDHAAALAALLFDGRPGETYNVAGRDERPNLAVVRAICAALDAELAEPARPSCAALIASVPDRPGHDRRYAIDDARLRGELGWAPRRALEEGLRETVRWYLDHRAWWEEIRARRYDGRRLGLR